MESITAILTVYRRPHTLVQQLAAIQNQSVPPSQIFIWKNQYDGIELPEIPQELMKNVSIINSSKNFGVSIEFMVARDASAAPTLPPPFTPRLLDALLSYLEENAMSTRFATAKHCAARLLPPRQSSVIRLYLAAILCAAM